jgi:hypothetical protein
MGDLLRVVLKHQSEVAAQGVLFQLPPGQALDGLLHGAQFAQTLPRIGQTNIDRLEGTLDQLRLVGQHGADSGDFVSEDGGFGMRDLAQRADQGGAVRVKVESPPPVLARGSSSQRHRVRCSSTRRAMSRGGRANGGSAGRSSPLWQ